MQKVTLPDGEKGPWKVTRFQTDRMDFFSAMYGRAVPVGEWFTRLTCKGRGVVMSDTPAERREHSYALHKATGSCLLNGLGIGMLLKNILLKPEVTDVTVVEMEQDVIDLVAPHYQDARLNIVHCSAFDYNPPKGKRYNMVWHDIWDAIDEDNLPEMGRLHRKYGRICDWQGSWAKERILADRRREREHERQWAPFRERFGFGT
jgi:hypothetical protein